MAVLFVVLICSTYGLIFNSVQANTITLSLQGAFGFDRTTVGIIVSIMTAMVIFGGINRIAKVSEWMGSCNGRYLSVNCFLCCY